MGCERGQASVEWGGLLLLVSLVFGALVAVVPAVDGRSFGSYLAHAILCSMRGGCRGGDSGLAHAYGGSDAALLRRFAPNNVDEPGARSPPGDLPPRRVAGCGPPAGGPGLRA